MFNFLSVSLLMLLSLSAVVPVGPLSLEGPPATNIQKVDPIETQFVDSIFQLMTEDERIGQLFMIRAHSDLGADHVAQVRKYIETYHVGGLCFFQGDPITQASLTNQYQTLVKHIPLMIAIDAEYGLAMRLKNTMRFPMALTQGAVQDNKLIYELGSIIGQQARAIGVNVNFAPVADINNNIDNPVINNRSYGEDRLNVSAKSYMFALGMQDQGVLACAKHFPGHGDTNSDSHHTLPVINHSRAELDSVELFPFRLLARQGVGSMMVAHLSVPALDNRPNRPTSLSKKVVQDLLRDSMGYQGLIFTDALEMKGVTDHFKNGTSSPEAILAGNDVLLLPDDLPAAYLQVKAYLADGRLSMDLINDRCRRILRYKYRMGIHETKPVLLDSIHATLHTEQAKETRRQVIQASMTLARNTKDLIPIKNVSTLKTAFLSIGGKTNPAFQRISSKYGSFKFLSAPADQTPEERLKLQRDLVTYDQVVISVHDMNRHAKKSFGISLSTRALVNNLSKQTNVLLVLFGSPYSLKFFDEVDHILCAYEEEPDFQALAAQALFGANAIEGKLPVTASERSKFGQGVQVASLKRLGFGTPESVGLSSTVLLGIDSLANELIQDKAAPGCYVWIARHGKVVYSKGFGHFTYSATTPINANHIYDLASVTKVAATTLSLMKLYDEKKYSLDFPVSSYISDLDTTNKRDLTLRNILSHRAGLRPWIPFFEATLTSEKRPDPQWYERRPNPPYTVRVSRSWFMNEEYTPQIWSQIYSSPLLSHRNYRYSDLGFYLSGKIIQNLSQLPLDQYTHAYFYKPLGLKTTMFNPSKRVSPSFLVPTEDDQYFRYERIQGYVHDMGAAMLGGVAGHAGLFSNAQDLGVIFQMLLNGGVYGGQRYLSEETIKLFTTRHYKESRRAIGFDMKELKPGTGGRRSNMSDQASERTFGHLGFTGTAVWADREEDLIFIFLSNRTFPSMQNGKLNKGEYRPRLQGIVYDAIIDEAVK